MPEVLADGVYFPATGTMHLVGCAFHLSPVVLPSQDFVLPLPQPPGSESPSAQDYYIRLDNDLYDPDNEHYTPLNSSTPEGCAISATVQYSPSNSLWNTDRVLKYSICSNRAKDDPLYFNPIERRAFLPYSRGYFESPNPNEVLQSQRRFETGGRIVLLVLGLLCVAQQIEHGRDNEKSLPFVSLVMITIQIVNHFSQTSIFKDLQIGGYNGGDYNRPEELVSEFYYYDLMAWSEHVLYQAMNMVGIVMYVWFFRKVSERRRIMKVRVVKQRSGAEDPPSEWKVMAATLAMFAFLILCFHCVFEDPAPWWPVAVVVGSAVQVLAVHFQFSKLLVNPQSGPKSSPPQV